MADGGGVEASGPIGLGGRAEVEVAVAEEEVLGPIRVFVKSKISCCTVSLFFAISNARVGASSGVCAQKG